MIVSIGSNYIADDSNVNFFEIINQNTVFINGNLGIGTDIPVANFHVEGISLNKSIYIPTSSNIFNIQNNTAYYALVPTGSILMYTGNNVSSGLQQLGWYECNGQSLDANNFPILKNIFAGQFGNTNPITSTIVLPDLRDKVGVGTTTIGNIPTLGLTPQALTADTIIQPFEVNANHNLTLSYSNLPPHHHNITSSGLEPIPQHSHLYLRRVTDTTVRIYRSGAAKFVTSISTPFSTFNTSNIGTTHKHTDFFNNSSTTLIAPITNLGTEQINIRQANISVIYLIKCT